MHVSDGFALAGGPWITPELSMQKLVWTKTFVSGNNRFNDTLARPKANEGYYKDIAIFAIPYPKAFSVSTNTVKPKITTSTGADASFLVEKDSKESFRCDSPCYIQYEFDKPFTARSLVTRTNGNNFQSHRFTIAVSDDGKNFRTVTQLLPPRHGWQDTDEDVTHAIPVTTGRFFRFVYNKSGTEPGAEDLDAAKWRQSLKVAGIELSAGPVINQYEGKNGSVWRIGRKSTKADLADEDCIAADKIIDITKHLQPGGRLDWSAPAGYWMILRMGHTSTGHTNATGGGGKGLECDKFNPDAVTLQFDKWFGESIRQVGPALAKKVLQIMHVDSWECGSQNWSPVFRNEFRKRRGYDLYDFLPVMAGVPIDDAAYSEKILLDVREIIATLVNENFYATLAELAKSKGVQFSAESVAPTMTSDGLLHYKNVDLPMGEFWVNSPTHDKPNDMLDAISGAHIYGKQIIQAEAFTTLRMDWSEHPGNLKALGDRNYALGINRLVYHVSTHNPWTDRKPGMTLDGIGLYFQRDQTWWKPGKAWVTYAQRCQALLQLGKPVVDLAVFTGTEMPRRSILPDRLVETLPGIFGDSVVRSEKKRLENAGLQLRELPDGVTHSANMADPEDWIDPLNGYAYDCVNPDVLRMAGSSNGRLQLQSGARYEILIMPRTHPMMPDAVAQPGILSKIAGMGLKVIREPFKESSFRSLGLEKDFEALDFNNRPAKGIAWTHRTDPAFDIYFVSNQFDHEQALQLHLRVAGKAPEIWDPVTGAISTVADWTVKDKRTILPVKLSAHGSLFIVFRQVAAATTATKGDKNRVITTVMDTLKKSWTVFFDSKFGGPSKTVRFDKLQDWTTNADSAIKYYSGTATYSQQFNYTKQVNGKCTWLDVGEVANLATIYVNGVNCGVAWTAPYRVDITKALREGANDLKIEVTNTWANRLIGDQFLPVEKRITWTTAPFRLKGKPLLKAGLLGPVTLNIEN